MSDVNPVQMRPSGPPETILPDAPAGATAALIAAEELSAPERRAAVAAVVAEFPRCIDAWAALGELGRDDVEAYAYFRIGYHRGLDLLRANGWRGSGYVRWAHPTNRGFLTALDGLRSRAAAIGEGDEEERISLFLRQLDPAWPPEGRA